jgi:two-component system, OmpR family, sensor histidine kinase KdpD
MTDDRRPDPDKLLSETKSGGAKGARLKIFFGMSAGVGKTYTMLKEARMLLERGEDVVIGWLESHGRKETDVLAEGMPVIARKTIEYRGISIQDMDIDAILERKPAIVLVDELAHTNAPGLTHPKRYQDVFDLVENGIDVYTTVNIQHIESITDVVEELTGARIRERVPDSVFDAADEIQLVDIPPEELLERLAEGKVYIGDKSQDAVSNFFKKENLAVLRELALKHATQIASHQLANILRGEVSSLSASDSQHILVAVSASPNSEYIIRWARRFTYTLKARWTAVHVETGAELSETDKEHLTRNITLARNLGATFMSLPGDDPVRAIIDYANQNSVASIIVGKSGAAAKRIFRGRSTLSERLGRESGKITIIAVQEKPVQEAVGKRIGKKINQSPAWQYGIVLAAVAAVTIINLFITRFTGYLSASILYLAAIILLSMVLDRLPIFITAFLFALSWDFLFIPPKYTFAISKIEDILMLLLYFLFALTSGWMTNRLKTNERMLIVREQRMSLLNELASVLETSGNPEDALRSGMEYITRAFREEAIAFLKKEDGSGLEEEPVNPDGFIRNEKEISAAHYCFKSGEATGRFTNTLPLADYHYVPMAAPGGSIGAIGIRLSGSRSWSTDQESFLLTLANTISLAVQREILYERNRKNLLLQESERLANLLLHSISHELRTPLTVIQGSASALLDEDTVRDAKARGLLIGDIVNGAERLNGIVESLLSMSRLESGKLRLNISDVDPEELVTIALRQAEKELGGRKTIITKQDVLPLVQCDMLLVIQVLVNLIRNAASYSQHDSQIEMEIEADETAAIFKVIDAGPGVKNGDLPHLFEKFYRGANATTRGTGLGLSISKGIVEAHGGSISARNISDGRFVVEFRLPLSAKSPDKGTS